MSLQVNIISPEGDSNSLSFVWAEGLKCIQLVQYVYQNYDYNIFNEVQITQSGKELEYDDVITETSIDIIVNKTEIPENLTLQDVFDKMQRIFQFSDDTQVAFIASSGQWEKKLCYFSRNAKYEEIIFIDGSQIYHTKLPKDIFEPKIEINANANQNMTNISDPKVENTSSEDEDENDVREREIDVILGNKEHYHMKIVCPEMTTKDELEKILTNEICRDTREHFIRTTIRKDGRNVTKNFKSDKFNVTEYQYWLTALKCIRKANTVLHNIDSDILLNYFNRKGI